MFDTTIVFREPRTTAWLAALSDWRAEASCGDFLGRIEIFETEIEAHQGTELIPAIAPYEWDVGRATKSLVEVVRQRVPVGKGSVLSFARLTNGMFATSGEAAAERLVLMPRIDRLRAVGSVIFGDDWFGPLAREIETDVRTVQRWADGEIEIPQFVDLLLIRAVHRASCRHVDQDLRRRADAIEALGRGNIDFIDDVPTAHQDAGELVVTR